MASRLCAKHRLELARWSDWGPHRPMPPGITLTVVASQRQLIRDACQEHRGCATEVS